MYRNNFKYTARNSVKANVNVIKSLYIMYMYFLVQFKPFCHRGIWSDNDSINCLTVFVYILFVSFMKVILSVCTCFICCRLWLTRCQTLILTVLKSATSRVPNRKESTFLTVGISALVYLRCIKRISGISCSKYLLFNLKSFISNENLSHLIKPK